MIGELSGYSFIIHHLLVQEFSGSTDFTLALAALSHCTLLPLLASPDVLQAALVDLVDAMRSTAGADDGEAQQCPYPRVKEWSDDESTVSTTGGTRMARPLPGVTRTKRQKRQAVERLGPMQWSHPSYHLHKMETA